ncbi:hypothetical protein [Alicyclobacillus shizuokensis]|uniref:hypothetical protein n=1 Tax=Alicyclobacillus shizuokensis TaxID=392014 RepID=UPI00082D7913|nr:hypothetical protein [Alicyclobacillus shizuokensis]MCL6626983.1 hypothetical protein [Alicyclobacillus shizuokensis]
MRRHTRPDASSRRRAMVYAGALVALGVYGIPRLPGLHPGLAGTFALVWILFLGLGIAANLYFVFGADRERVRMLEEMDIYPERERTRSGSLERGSL